MSTRGTAALGIGTAVGLFALAALVVLVGAPAGTPRGTSGARATEGLFDELLCPCGCGSHLPGSSKLPACFGCSVGKAELASIREGLKAGRTPVELLLELSRPVLVDVFADYTDPGLRETWTRAKRVASELHQNRVVLRTPGRSPEAIHAVKLAECARERGAFFRVQEALVRHTGPWDQAALVALARGAGLETNGLGECLEHTDVAAQIAKDREHARERGIARGPAVSVNRAVVPDADAELRRAIRKVTREHGI